MDLFIEILQKIATWVWQPLFIILIGTGLYLTFKLRAIQFRKLGYALKLAFTRHDDEAQGDISHFQALMTALAATIGIGNIAGVATAIAMGGMGALFWLWVTSLIGMSSKYSEALLAIEYRIKDNRGEMAGGPMYYIERGLQWRKMAILFAACGVVTTLFTGNVVQSNSIAAALHSSFSMNYLVTGALLALATAVTLIGGIQSIGRVTSFLVPFMAVFYILGTMVVLGVFYREIPEAFMLIFKTAFTGQAAIGGFAGSTIMMAVQMGVSRGIFSNESGLGTAPIAAAAAKTDMPGRQALISMTGAFLSTIVCTFTGLALAVTSVLGIVGEDGRLINGVPLTMIAFDAAIPWGGLIVTIGSILFGFSTIIGWAYYGEKCCEYLAGTKSIIYYRSLYSLVVFCGVVMPLEIVWALADIANAFMALPNLIALVALSNVVVVGTKAFFRKVEQESLVLR